MKFLALFLALFIGTAGFYFFYLSFWFFNEWSKFK